jgi:hypothetical protein
MGDEEAETKYVFKPGYRVEGKGIKGVVTIQIFEQLQGAQYIYAIATKKLPGEPHETYDESIQHSVGMPEGNCAPIEKAPWSLVEKPLPSGTESELWQEVKQFVYDHLFLPDETLYDVLTAWVFASWIPEVWSVVPYVFFYGPVASGKTRGLEVLHRLSYRAILSSNISSAALFRAAEAWKPTLILDETEIYNRQEKSEVIGLLNSGYRRGQFAIRVKTSEEGELLECFDVFGFKALAGTEGLAKTLESRSIMIRMLKNRRRVNLHIDEKKAEELRAKLLDWRIKTLTNAELSEVVEAFTTRIGQLNFDSGRLEELFQCLLAVSNDGRESILKYAEKMLEIRQFEEMTSYEADIVEAMLDENLVVENGVILTKDLTEKLNANKPEREQLKTRSVGWVIRRLGFEPRHTKHGNGWFYDKPRLDYLKSIYLDRTPLQKEVQQVHQVHLPIPSTSHNGEVSEVSEVLLASGMPQGKPYFNACYYCQKPIYTPDAVMNMFTEHKPAHKECWEAQQATMKGEKHE